MKGGNVKLISMITDRAVYSINFFFCGCNFSPNELYAGSYVFELLDIGLQFPPVFVLLFIDYLGKKGDASEIRSKTGSINLTGLLIISSIK